MSQKKIIRQKIKNNSHVIDLFSTEDLIKAWQGATKKDVAQTIGKTMRSLADFASAAIDMKTALKLIEDLGARGQVVLKSVLFAE